MSASATPAPARDVVTPDAIPARRPASASRERFDQISLRRTGCLGSCPEFEVVSRTAT